MIEYYLDGVSAGTVAFDYIAPASNAECGIGAFAGQPTDIIVDELAIYDRALSPSRIVEHVAASR